MTIVFILAAILMFGILIAVHEFGHFAAAKLCGVRVNEFSIGMGPAIWTRQRGETQYSLRALPIGGYCAMEGEDEDTGDERSLTRQGFWKQLIIFAAGALMNFLTGVVILLALYANVTAVKYRSDHRPSPGACPAGDRAAGGGSHLQGGWIPDVSVRETRRCFCSTPTIPWIVEVIRDGEHVLIEDLRRQTYTAA